MSSGAGPGSEREEKIRRLLAEAVEPVEPGPGAKTRLLARARAQQRRRRRPLLARLALPAVLASLLIVLGVTVVFATRGGRGSGSSASTSAGSAPAGAASRAPSHALASPAAGGSAHSGPYLPVPPSKRLEEGKGAGSTFGSAAQSNTDGAEPAPLALHIPADLDGDGRPDSFTLGTGTLAAQLSSLGLEAVSLPSLGPGAKVLGVTWLINAHGQPVPVVFVRLRQVGASSTDTVAGLVNGYLTVLQQGSGPVLLTTDASHRYACNGGALVESGKPTPLVVDGAQLVASSQELKAATAATTSSGCF